VIVAVLVLLLQSPRDGGCTEWRDCRQQALAAADSGAYETFHDLAWRAVQTGPPNDPALMYLLARAQALSGRPHDALVMLRRLADMGVPSDADSNHDFVRTRELPGWPELSARLDRLVRADTPGADPAAAPTPPIAPTPPVAPPPPSPAASPAEALRFSTGDFSLSGLAYDAVSDRFLFGDRLGRKLIVVGTNSNHAVDFVRADSAGFHDISAIEIDTRRGDLWVASTAPGDGAGTLHKLQLVSGRPLKSFPAAADLQPVAFVDLAVTPAGAVLVLDSAGQQVLVLRPGGSSLERVIRLDAEGPASLAAGADDAIAYVAYRDGVSRIDLRARTATRVTAPSSISLAHLERIRWSGHALIGVQVEDDGSRRIIRLDLNASGRAVTKGATVERSVPATAQTFAIVSGDELVYLTDGSGPGGHAPGGAAGATEFVAYRVRLR